MFHDRKDAGEKLADALKTYKNKREAIEILEKSVNFS
jgi:predicted phosphoribosyltransferase